MIHRWLLMMLVAALVLLTGASDAVAGPRDEVLKKLNEHSSVKGSESTKNYKIIFDAYLKMTEPPMPLDENFNLTTIHPKMAQWSAVAGWAESNPHMAEAVLKAWETNTIIVGLPYGEENVPQNYRDAGIMIAIGMNDSLRNNEFRYMYSVEAIAAFVTAEVYRLMEADQVDRALSLAVAHAVLLRQFCDRDFLIEKLAFIDLLSESLSNLRDVFYVYQAKISPTWFTDVAQIDIPFLNPDRSRLFMPEADKILAEALIREVFDGNTGRADAEKFALVFGAVQSADRPLTRFGTARRWTNIAAVHGSLDASLERLKFVYDDWWRRWRVKGHDPILELQTQFSATNPVRYAAVLYSMQNVEELFAKRDRLLLEVNGTSTAAGLCGYKASRGNYPDKAERMYAEFGRKNVNVDPYDFNLEELKYEVLNARRAIDLPGNKRIWVEAKEAMLWSKGQNYSDDRAAVHTPEGSQGDIVVWPPVKALERKQGVTP